MEVIVHFFFYGLGHERRDHVFELWQFRLNAPYSDECLVLARMMQFFVSLLMIIINMRRILMPFLQIPLKPLMLLVLDRVFQLPYFLFHVVRGIVNLVHVVLQSLYLLLRGVGKALCRARVAHYLRVLKIRQAVLILHAEAVELLLGWRVLAHKNNLAVLRNILEVPDKFAIQSVERLERFLSLVDVLGAQLDDFQHRRHLESILELLPIVCSADHGADLLRNVKVVLGDVFVDVNPQLLLHGIPRLLDLLRWRLLVIILGKNTIFMAELGHARWSRC